ncbi:ethanolamine utilization protein EutH [Lacrimispora sp.]|uniref:ethanolamine utilization protein EutH n=1 Tax=Lacrimispora sp. TaxID=2719234 RepID=UPI003FA5D778
MAGERQCRGVVHDHLGFCSAVAPEWILPMVCGKMAGGILAVAIASILPGMGRKKSAVRPSA